MAEGKNRVLIVDDEETVGIGMSEMLKDAGFSAGYAVSGIAALEEVKKGGHALIFMDMMMPGLNGLETYRKIREINHDVKVVLFTGYFREVDKAIYQGVREGMIDVYIRKPFFSEEIVATAKRYAHQA
ncbi:MAG: response regulator [Deltaproteobacteria bacterium]|nr:response regulator [Deltaproteobacteria bacterium]